MKRVFLPSCKLFWRRNSVSQLLSGFPPSFELKNVCMGRHISIYLSLFKYCFYFSRDSCFSLKRLAFVCNLTRCFRFFYFFSFFFFLSAASEKCFNFSRAMRSQATFCAKISSRSKTLVQKTKSKAALLIIIIFLNLYIYFYI